MASGIKVKDVMIRAVVNVKKTDSLKKIVEIMTKAKIGSVIITENQKVIGILTEGDIIKKVLGKELDYKKMTADKVMSHPVRTINQDIDLENAIRIMRDLNIERLPVVKKEKLVGLITEREIIRAEPALLELTKQKVELSAIKPSEPVTISGECEECGNYADTLRQVVSEDYVCEECRKEEE